MTKLQFLLSLHHKLSDLPQDDVEERLNFYSEMIEDRMEEGLPEEDAVSAVGSVDKIAAQITADICPTQKVAKKPAPKRYFKAWEVVLLVLGSPLWLSLLLAAFAVILSLYISLGAVVVSLWAVFGTLIGCAFGCVVAGAIFAVCGNELPGIAMIGAGAVCAGLSIFLFYGCKAATKGILLLAKMLVAWLKKLFVKKEVA